jgi:hypothetical protein
VGGGVALQIDPDALRRLAAGRQVALVSATNGKSTTTRLLAEALGTAGAVAYNATGANMAEGLVTTLDAERRAPYAVLETDEAYLGPIAQATRPRSILLMNLSRDYLERGVRSKALASHWQATLAALTWPCTVVANADDPLVAWAVRDHRNVVWVAGGMWWDVDGEVCRTWRVRLRRDGDDWSCATCGLARAEPAWQVRGGRVGAVLLAIDAGFQVAGRTFVDPECGEHDGLGLLDVRSSRGAFVDGAVVGTLTFVPGLPELAGFESHRGRSVVGPDAVPFARLEVGTGNGGEPATDGAVAGRVIGTYVHGPLLAWNPALADHLLGMLLGAPLAPLADEPDFAAEVRARRMAEARQTLQQQRR